MAAKDGAGSGDLPPLVEVTCVTRAAPKDLQQGVQAIGGIRGGVTWKLSQAEAIAAIVASDARFFVHTPRGTAAVVVAVDDGGHGYLKASWDVSLPATLLALPQCPEGSAGLPPDFDWYENRRRRD